ncbi:hypothetical protein AB0J57_00615 [Streptomyces sp. NPDC049837]|uniref:hypothetical protein n=1 Tax=Streptomyces sp. NPDC049837 TaxID=3155277 RepID=UPI0034358B8F
MNVREVIGRVAPGAVALAAAAMAVLAPVAAAAPSDVPVPGVPVPGVPVGTATACTAWRTLQAGEDDTGVKFRECDRRTGPHTQTKAQLYVPDDARDGEVAQVYTATGSNLGGRWYRTWHMYYVRGTASHGPLVDTGWHNGHDVRVLLKNVLG